MWTNVALSIHNKLHSQIVEYILTLKYLNVNSSLFIYWCSDIFDGTVIMCIINQNYYLGFYI